MLQRKITDYFRGICPVGRRGGAVSAGEGAHAKCMEKVLTAWHAREGGMAGNGRRSSPISCSSWCLTPRSLWLSFLEDNWEPLNSDNASIGIFGTNNQCTSNTLFQMTSKVSSSPGWVFERFLTVATKVNVSLMGLSWALHSAWLFYHLKSFSPHNEK